MAAHHIKTSHPPSRGSIRRAPTRDAHQWQHTASKSAIPHLDARFHKRPLETHISGMTAHQNQLSPSRRSIPRATIRSFTNRSDSWKAGSRVRTRIDGYFNPAMRDKATTCRSLSGFSRWQLRCLSPTPLRESEFGDEESDTTLHCTSTPWASQQAQEHRVPERDP